MANSDASSAPLDPRLAAIRDFQGKYPKQLWWLFLSEMWERFCFYGMRGALTVFMITQLALGEKEANLQYGAIQSFVYTMTFVGGFFADRVLGFRRSIAWGGLLMVIGSFTIAASPKELFYIGTSISIIGTGFFKPNISGVVGMLYHEGDPRRDAGFSLFYSGINIGAMLGGILCVSLGKNYGWNWCFLSTGLVMILGLLVFTSTSRQLEPLGHSPL
jgi:POT family proton-dependent oligopeptide transporter